MTAELLDCPLVRLCFARHSSSHVSEIELIHVEIVQTVRLDETPFKIIETITQLVFSQRGCLISRSGLPNGVSCVENIDAVGACVAGFQSLEQSDKDHGEG